MGQWQQHPQYSLESARLHGDRHLGGVPGCHSHRPFVLLLLLLLMWVDVDVDVCVVVGVAPKNSERDPRRIVLMIWNGRSP